MQTADVVIVGAGVVGASIAWRLAARGASVVVLERAPAAGLGSTSRATGGFRAQFSTAVNVRLSLRSREKFQSFAGEVGADSGYAPRGYLFVAFTEAEMNVLKAAHAVQQENGLHEARIISPHEVLERNPAISPDLEIAGGAWCPTDGFIRAKAITDGYVAAARRRGVRFVFETDVTGAHASGSNVDALGTTSGLFAAGTFVNAAGAWARPLMQQLGADVPVVPLTRHVAATVPAEALPESMPMTVFLSDGFHLRVRDGRILLLRPHTPEGRDPFDTTFEPEWLDETVRIAHDRIPVMRKVEVDPEACWSGLYEMSPDHHAIAGRAADFENLYLANGSSGHGVMHAPALGEVIAEMILDGQSRIPGIEALRPSRFREGAAIASSQLL